ncbi:MAG: hypothetical protein ACP5U2_02625 [Bryobacteraceae bacterium]
MFGWLRRLRPEPRLAGAPAVRRLKHYSAASGFVYQYYYQGCRAAWRGLDKGAQYVFAVSADGKTYFPVSVFVGRRALRDSEQRRRRTLSSTERYALAKMSLFQAFDARPSPGALREEVIVQPADVESILARLGLD